MDCTWSGAPWDEDEQLQGGRSAKNNMGGAC